MKFEKMKELLKVTWIKNLSLIIIVLSLIVGNYFIGLHDVSVIFNFNVHKHEYLQRWYYIQEDSSEKAIEPIFLVGLNFSNDCEGLEVTTDIKNITNAIVCTFRI